MKLFTWDFDDFAIREIILPVDIVFYWNANFSANGCLSQEKKIFN